MFSSALSVVDRVSGAMIVALNDCVSSEITDNIVDSTVDSALIDELKNVIGLASLEEGSVDLVTIVLVEVLPESVGIRSTELVLVEAIFELVGTCVIILNTGDAVVNPIVVDVTEPPNREHAMQRQFGGAAEQFCTFDQQKLRKYIKIQIQSSFHRFALVADHCIMVPGQWNSNWFR
jgi:hypothetical protein